MRYRRAAQILGTLVVMGSPSIALGETVYLQVKSSQMRSAPEFFAPAVGAVSYGDALQKLGEEDGWAKVSGNGKTGYLPVSAVSEKPVVFSSRSSGKVQADPSEVVLAGKGFSKEVEEQYRGSDPSLRFDLVDRLERAAAVDRKDVQKFVKAGGLRSS